MSETFTLVDSLALGDLHTYLSRAQKVDSASVRLIAGGGVLAVYSGVIFPIGLLDDSPTVLGLRTFALTEPAVFDAVVPIRSLLERIARLQSDDRVQDVPVTVGVPIQVNTATWAAISPPRGGWRSLSSCDAALLETTARAGIDEIAAAVPDRLGEQIVHHVRSEVWGRGIPGVEYVPAGAAFAAFSLGFLGSAAPDSLGLPASEAGLPSPDEVPAVPVPSAASVSIFETGPWTRLTTPRGHVLVRRRGWTLQR